MVNIKNITVSQDGGFKRISVAYDEVQDGRIVGTNNRVTRIISDDDTIIESVNNLMEYAQTMAQEG